MVHLKQGWNRAGRSRSFTGIMGKILPIVIFVELEEVHRKASKMIRDEEAGLELGEEKAGEGGQHQDVPNEGGTG